MQNKKIVLVLALGMILSPTLALYAEEIGASAGTNIKINNGQDIKGKTPLPPVINPNLKPRIGGQGDPSDKSTTDDKSLSGPKFEGEVEGSANLDARVQMSPEELKANMEKRLEVMKENRTKIQATAEARKKEIKKKLEDKKGEIKKKLDAKAKERVQKTLDQVFKGLNDQIEKLSKIDATIGDKITALEQSGADITTISAQYTIAQTALEKAKVDVKATSSLSIDQTSTSTSKEALRALVKIAEDSIRVAGGEYKKVIGLMPDTDGDREVETNTNTSTKVEQ